MRRRIIFLVCLTFCPVAPLHAWNDTGHKIVGLLVYERLTPAARSNADALLLAHPHHAALLAKNAPADADLKLWVFLTASTWPDLVRPAFGPNRKPEEITKYHRGDWHYLNIPYIWPADTARFATAQLPTGGELLNAIARCRQILGNRSQPAAERAVHLAWLLHLVEDLHQPLHSSAMYSARTMKGDQGGNLVAVRRGNGVVKLHSYWDGALGSGESLKFIREIAGELRREHLQDARKSLPELAQAITPDAWIKESYAAAIETAYAKGRLEWRAWDDWEKKDKTGLKATDFPAIDPDYAINARVVARRRAALAAVRLADLLNELLKQ